MDEVLPGRRGGMGRRGSRCAPWTPAGVETPAAGRAGVLRNGRTGCGVTRGGGMVDGMETFGARRPGVGMTYFPDAQ